MRENDDNFYKAFDDPRKISVSTLVAAEKCALTATNYFINYFSSWYRLKVVAAGLLRCKAYLMNRVREVDTEKYAERPISVEELKCAETAVIAYVQRQAFPECFF